MFSTPGKRRWKRTDEVGEVEEKTIIKYSPKWKEIAVERSERGTPYVLL